MKMFEKLLTYASLSLSELTNVSASNRYANFVSTGGYASKDEV